MYQLTYLTREAPKSGSSSRRQMADERYYNTDEQRDQGEAEWAEVSTSRFPHGPSLNDKLYDLGTDRDNTNYAQDTAETVYISSLALLKMLKHGRAELPKEAVGLMLGDFPDEFTVNVVDVFPMPPGTVRATFTNALFSPLLSYKPFFLERVLIYVQGVSVEAFGIPDPVPEGSVRPPCYPLDMIDKLKETGRLETVPALHHGLNHRYYSIRIDHKFQENELEMLLKVYKTLRLDLPQSIRLKREKMEKERRASSFSARAEQNKTAMQSVLKRVGDCNKALEEAEQNPMTRQQRAIKYFGKQDPLRHIKEEIAEMMWDNIEQLADAIWPNKDIAFVPQKQEEQNPPAVQKMRQIDIHRIVNFAQQQLDKAVKDSNAPDTSETVYISSLALLKMLKHGRAGVPMEVMGLMLGEFVDEYTINVVDVFAMPQSGTGVSVEAVDPVFQAKMLDMLKQTGRPEMVVGWYHSHPGFGCWLSNTDINTQKSFEALSDRAVAVVIDSIQSVKGKVVIDAFRTIDREKNWIDPRQTTSNLGHLTKPSRKALSCGLNAHYYSIPVACKCQDNEQKMLLTLHQKSWMHSMQLDSFSKCAGRNKEGMQSMLKYAGYYKKAVEEEEWMTDEQLAIRNVGRQDPKRHIGEEVCKLLSDNIVQSLGTMMDTVAFSQS
uniref:Rpn-11 n=1 Tax=Pristionchus pacificus TaxID=54126 RepID=A0A2A6B995_PRIPA|eukprot:PDM62437.1 rpn-11 [Pristionchus pacificus]